jgi:hypothetical protein
MSDGWHTCVPIVNVWRLPDGLMVVDVPGEDLSLVTP